MAEECDDNILLLALEKLSAVPPLWPNNASNFKIKGYEIECVVKAISSFEAATKFLSFCLHEIHGFAEHEPTSKNIEISDEANDCYVYSIRILNNKPLVELNYVLKNTPLHSERTTSNDQSSKDFEESNLSQDINIERGKLVDNTLRQYFGFTSFRPLQRETIITTMNGKDAMTVVGTGGGKTLMYLLPAVISAKTTLVVSPILSLIDDILARCYNLSIPACKFTGDVPKEVQTTQQLNIKQYKIVVGTPEMLKDEEFNSTVMSMIEKNELERIVFDEAHTIISWGNLFLKVQERTSKFNNDLKSFILERKDDSGIIYCVLPKDVSLIHAGLSKNGIDCVKYHGKLSEEVKSNSYSKWVKGECKVIVANSSFGMGIDKKDVRYVIHDRIPTSIDKYYQQCGRAGHDGLPATCLLFYKYGDKNMLMKMFQMQSELNQQIASVNELIHFLEDPVQCRHRRLMLFFGEEITSFICRTSCDNCCTRGSFYITDGTSDALKVLQAVVELTERVFTCDTLKLFLLGSRQKSILEQDLDSLVNFGSLEKRFVPTVLLDKFLHSLINSGILAENSRKKGKSLYAQLVLGPKAHDLMALRLSVSRYDT
ncbi:ATP-dependent DNA helicase Q1-like [Dendronephthya gigantea]|uniref:ATP-dependent DNA helicase Q1-like n=1 Tax=Dendronephthya gigantea TaxID=151771 RepID=UPI00106922CB|nr:ATP-dependent DNA helicase Q1-like [Dendronephthya gigantea]